MWVDALIHSLFSISWQYKNGGKELAYVIKIHIHMELIIFKTFLSSLNRLRNTHKQ